MVCLKGLWYQFCGNDIPAAQETLVAQPHWVQYTSHHNNTQLDEKRRRVRLRLLVADETSIQIFNLLDVCAIQAYLHHCSLDAQAKALDGGVSGHLGLDIDAVLHPPHTVL